MGGYCRSCGPQVQKDLGHPPQADPAANKTIISGGGDKQALLSIDDDVTTLVNGFYISDGWAEGWLERGGGVYLENSNAIFVNCVFENNDAFYVGAAAANYGGGSPQFVNCIFRNNGGVESLTGRKAGPPVTFTGAPLSFTGPFGGGAIANDEGNPVFTNCLFHGNRAAEGGAILNLMDGTVTLINCTIADNEATFKKGGAIFDGSGTAVVRNCILWNNASPVVETKEIYNDRSEGSPAGTTDVMDSVVTGYWTGNGNLDVDPQLVNPAAGDYRLDRNSPILDRGWKPE